MKIDKDENLMIILVIFYLIIVIILCIVISQLKEDKVNDKWEVKTCPINEVIETSETTKKDYKRNGGNKRWHREIVLLN